MSETQTFDLNECMAQVKKAAAKGDLTQSAVKNISIWLSESR